MNITKSKLRFVVPNVFTALNFLIAIMAILLCMNVLTFSYFGKTASLLAAHLVVYCVLLDKLDGFMAKVCHAASAFGAQFDSLADLIAFGIAPPLCMLFALQNADAAPQNYPLLILAALAYMLCTAIRLARYNAVDDESHEESSDHFSGLPSTMAGGFNALLVIILAGNTVTVDVDLQAQVMLCSLVISSVFMVSTFALPKLQSRKSRFVNIVQLLGVACGYVFGFLMLYAEFIYFLILCYCLIGFIHSAFQANTDTSSNDVKT